MYRRLATVVCWCAVLAAPALTARAYAQPATIHPAVARIMAAESGGASFGSGTLVAVNDQYGLVVTNWHVVRDTNGFVLVTFSDGFRSPATVVRVDRDWDLAALLIWRPRVQPVRLSSQPPQPGEMLTIAGYGKGAYRAAAGACTQYLSPGGTLPYETVEVAAAAREGDSGGPIFNSRGELAGVLWGSAWGKTAGSYCGRVQSFLAPTIAQLEREPSTTTMLARNQPAAPGMPASGTAAAAAPADMSPPAAIAVRPLPVIGAGLTGVVEDRNRNTASELTALPDAPPPTAAIAAAGAQRSAGANLPGAGSQPGAGVSARPAERPESAAVGGRSPSTSTATAAKAAAAVPDGGYDRLKTVFAAIGLILLAFNGLRLLGRAVG